MVASRSASASPPLRWGSCEESVVSSGLAMPRRYPGGGRRPGHPCGQDEVRGRRLGSDVHRAGARRDRARRAGAARAPRRRRRPGRAGAARQRRLRDGHRRGRHRAGPGPRRAGAGRGAARRGRRRARPGLHHARGAGRPPRRAVRRRRDRAGAGRLDARRHRAPRPGAAGRRAGGASWSPTSRWRSPRPARAPTTWCCSTSTTGPGYLVHDANAALYRAPALAAARDALRPGGVLVVWSAAESPQLEAAMAGVFGAAEARPLPVRLQEREEHYWLYVARAAAVTSGP